MKRLTGVLLSIVLLFTMLPMTAAMQSESVDTENPGQTQKLSFTDILKEEYYYEAVLWSVEQGITGGTSATTFSPNASCTRAQAVTFLHRMVASPEPAAIDMLFTDVTSDRYYYKPIKWAVGSKIAGGMSSTAFCPDLYCTRAQTITFLWRTSGCPKIDGDNPFTDISDDAYYYDAVLWAVKNGITGGTDVDNFGPEEHCTRAQTVTFLYRMICGV